MKTVTKEMLLQSAQASLNPEQMEHFYAIADDGDTLQRVANGISKHLADLPADAPESQPDYLDGVNVPRLMATLSKIGVAHTEGGEEHVAANLATNINRLTLAVENFQFSADQSDNAPHFIPVTCSYLERDSDGVITRASLYFGDSRTELVVYTRQPSDDKAVHTLLHEPISAANPLPPGCFCPLGQCNAPVIMGRLTPCRRGMVIVQPSSVTFSGMAQTNLSPLADTKPKCAAQQEIRACATPAACEAEGCADPMGCCEEAEQPASKPSDGKDAAHWKVIRDCALEEAVGLFNGASRYNISEQMAINRIRALQSTPSPIGESKADTPAQVDGVAVDDEDFDASCTDCHSLTHCDCEYELPASEIIDDGSPTDTEFNSLLDTPAQGPHDPAGDWPEDFHLENGNYFNECLTCKKQFLGYKRRHTCKVCSEQPASVTLTDEDLCAIVDIAGRESDEWAESLTIEPNTTQSNADFCRRILAAHQQKVGG